MADPVDDIIGDYRAFAAQQCDRLLGRHRHRAVRAQPPRLVTFHRLSLRASVELDAGPSDDGFHHVDDRVPQRLVTATGPNPLPR